MDSDLEKVSLRDNGNDEKLSKLLRESRNYGDSTGARNYFFHGNDLINAKNDFDIIISNIYDYTRNKSNISKDEYDAIIIQFNALLNERCNKKYTPFCSKVKELKKGFENDWKEKITFGGKNKSIKKNKKTRKHRKKKTRRGGMFSSNPFRNYKLNPLTPEEEAARKKNFLKNVSPLKKTEGYSSMGLNVRSNLFGKKDCNDKYINGLTEGGFDILTHSEKEEEYKKCCANKSIIAPPYCLAMNKNIKITNELNKKNEERQLAIKYLSNNGTNYDMSIHQAQEGGKKRKTPKK